MKVVIEHQIASVDVEFNIEQMDFEDQLVSTLVRALRAVGANPVKIGKMIVAYEGGGDDEQV